MGEKNNKKFSIIEIVKNNKTLRYVLVAILVIVLILLMSSSIFSENKQTSNENYLTEYTKAIEERLSEVLSEVEGAGDVKVVISVESGNETVLAMKTVIKETSTGKEIEETPVIVNGKTVVLKELTPKISGVLIVCEGANNIAVKSRLVSATRSLLDIENGKIEILTMK